METQVSSRDVLADSWNKKVWLDASERVRLTFLTSLFPQGSTTEGQERSPGPELYPEVWGGGTWGMEGRDRKNHTEDSQRAPKGHRSY